MSAPIQIVDKNDQPLGAATRQEAWAKGLIHRVVRVMIEDGHGNLLLQHRHPNKDTYPDCWDNSVAGHVDAGESYSEAAKREMQEELGLEDLPLQEIGYYYVDSEWHGLKKQQFCRTYKAITTETPAKLEPGKIDAVRWFSIEEAKQLVREHPEQVSDGLRQVIERFYA